MVGYGATAYGRRTGSLKLQPFPWSEVGAFAEGWSVEGRIRAWSVFGGIPYYLKEIDPASSLAEVIRRASSTPTACCATSRASCSPRRAGCETSTPTCPISCLRAIAAGVTRLNEIAQRIGRRRSEEARPFLERLEEMGLVERRYPVTQPSGKRVNYAIADPFLRFWFRFVAPRESRLHSPADADRYLAEAVLPQLDTAYFR